MLFAGRLKPAILMAALKGCASFLFWMAENEKEAGEGRRRRKGPSASVGRLLRAAALSCACAALCGCPQPRLAISCSAASCTLSCPSARQSPPVSVSRVLASVTRWPP